VDQLEITGLSLSTRIGIHPWEQKILQRLLVDITIPLDLSQCNNELSKTIDYAVLSERITAFVEDQSFELIETVAEKIAMLIKTEFLAEQVTIKVCKPHAVKNAGNISIKIAR
jgi:dihydroneopterin aldolase